MRVVVVVFGLLAASVIASAAAIDMKPILDPYLRIQQALAADGLDGVKDSARAIADEAAKLGADGQPIQTAAGELQQAADLKAARAAFGRLGDAVMILAKQSGAALGDDVKVAYCPMVRKYWLQKGEEIRNPFYGKQMLECGRLNPDLPDLQK